MVPEKACAREPRAPGEGDLGVQIATVLPGGEIARPRAGSREGRVGRIGPWAWVLLPAVLALLPVALGPYHLQLAVLTVAAAVMALSWDMLARAGLLSLGHAAFFGTGAYVAALSYHRWEMHPLVTMLVAALAGTLLAGLLGLATLRLHGMFFTIATYAFGEVLCRVTLQLPGLTGGAMGIAVPPLFGGDRVRCYYLLLLFFSVALAASVLTERGRCRLALAAMRCRVEVAGVLGIDVVRWRVALFMGSAVFPALMGAYYIHYTTYMIPYEAFSLNTAVSSLVMPIVGGLYSTAGPLVGALLLKVVEEYLRVTITYGYMIVYGALLVVVILAMPDGLVGVWRRWRSSR